MLRCQLLCSLKENVQYEEIPAVFTVQKCHKMKERVCDTVYETELTEKDDYKCIHVVNPYCAKKDRTVYDKTCRTMVNFDLRLRVVIHMELALIAMVMQDMAQLLEGMEKVIMNQNTNVTRPMKLNAIQLLVQYHRIIVKIGKRKSARN